MKASKTRLGIVLLGFLLAMAIIIVIQSVQENRSLGDSILVALVFVVLLAPLFAIAFYVGRRAINAGRGFMGGIFGSALGVGMAAGLADYLLKENPSLGSSILRGLSATAIGLVVGVFVYGLGNTIRRSSRDH